MNRRLIALLVAVAVVATALWWFMLWSPRQDEIAAANERQAVAQQQVDQLRVQLSRLKQAQAQEPARRAQLEVLKSAVPDTPALAEFILAMNDVAISAGVEFASISVTPPTAGSGALSTMATTISVTGGYAQILDIINRINLMPRLVTVDSFSLAPQGAVAGQQSFSVSLSCRTFTRATEISPSTTLPAAPAPATPTTAPGGVSTTLVGTSPTTVAP